jgi:hypothetical protein
MKIIKENRLISQRQRSLGSVMESNPAKVEEEGLLDHVVLGGKSVA